MAQIPVEHETYVRVQHGNRMVVVYECKAAGSCGLYIEGTHTAVSAHLRRHGITAPGQNIIDCPWGGCSKTIKKDSLPRHILTHMGVKARCSVCGLIGSRRDVIRAHIASSENCRLV